MTGRTWMCWGTALVLFARAAALGDEPGALAPTVSDVLAQAKRENYRANLIEAYDQPWKRQLEGTVGGHWGLFDAYRRETVRVDGAEVTQFTVSVHMPESVYREANQKTMRNIVLVVLRSIGAIGLLALIVTGVVAASIRRRPNWMRALRWTLALAIVPLLSAAADHESALFGYSTSVKWDTFMTGYIVEIVRDVGLRLGGLFLAVVAIDAAVPYALDSLSREARARFGHTADELEQRALGPVRRAVLGHADVLSRAPSPSRRHPRVLLPDPRQQHLHNDRS